MSIYESENLELNYYLVMPCKVALDNNISNNAKVLYSLISGLCRQKGYCWATNAYLGDLLKKDIRTIRNWLKELIDYGHIVVEVIRDEKTQEVLERRIYLKAAKLEEQASGSQNIPAANTEKSFPAPQEKSFPTPQEKSFMRLGTDFPIEYNNINNINNISFPPSEKKHKNSPPARSKDLEKKPPNNKFKLAPPESLEEVQLYFQYEELETDPVKFFYYYEGRGWKGINNWQIAAKAWTDIGYNQNGKRHKNKYQEDNIYNSLSREDLNKL